MTKNNSNFLKTFDLSHRTALITGAGGLLGYEHSFALLELGAHVVLTDNNEKALEKTSDVLAEKFGSNNITSRPMDVTDEKSIEAVSHELGLADKTVSILLNNASINPNVDTCGGVNSSGTFEKFSVREWNNQINVGLTGAFLCSKIFGSQMVTKKRQGVILNIASDLSVIAPDQRIYRTANDPDEVQSVKPVTYSVVKTGIIGLTRYLSTYWADKGIRCNAISPGGIFDNQNEEFVKRLTSLIPLGRMASPSEYRGAIQFMCSDASLYLTGQNIVIDGGRTVW